ncbi:unnamed protein product [Brassica oleracea var. botrytis]|uniref:Uncharacterized protein n=1 Tax=Brassica oleracea TaxID=3712 RepID=A0A3P6ACS7_BRAOL|nr:unnamed protein product [Brassica oleracea]
MYTCACASVDMVTSIYDVNIKTLQGTWPSAQWHSHVFSQTIMCSQPLITSTGQCLFGSNPEIAHLVNAVEVTRVETMTIGEIYAYMKQESAKVNLMLQITYSAQHS